MKNPWLWIILTVAAVLRVALLASACDEKQLFTPDSRDYNRLARNMIEDREFSRIGKPEIFRTPGYPAFVAGIYWLSGNSTFAVAGVQIGLDTILCLLTFLLGRELISARVGLVAAGLQAISPVAIVSSVRLLTGGPFALLMTAALLALVKCLKTSRWQWALLAGILAGPACLVKPIALPLVLIAVMAMLVRIWQWRSGLAFALAATFLLPPWVARNYFRAGYVGLSSVGDYNLLYCNAAAVVEAKPDIELSRLQNSLRNLGTWGTWELVNDPRILADCRREGLKIIASHPFTYARAHAQTTPNVFLPAATDVLEVMGVTAGGKGTLAVLRTQGYPAAVKHYFGKNTWAIWLCVPMLAIVAAKYLFALIWIPTAVRAKPRGEHWLAIVMFLYFVLIPGPVAHARFRLPIAPLISIAAAAGICWLAGKCRARRSKTPSGPLHA